MAKYNFKENPQKTVITTLTPNSFDNMKTKKLGIYLSTDKEIFHKKTLTLVAMNELWILWHKISQKKKLRMFNSLHIALQLWHVVIDKNRRRETKSFSPTSSSKSHRRFLARKNLK